MLAEKLKSALSFFGLSALQNVKKLKILPGIFNSGYQEINLRRKGNAPGRTGSGGKQKWRVQSYTRDLNVRSALN